MGDDDIANRIRNTRDALEAYKKSAKSIFEELIRKLQYYSELAEMLRTDSTFRNEIGGHLPYSIDNGELSQKWRQALTRYYRILVEEYGPRQINANSIEFQTTLKLLGKLAKINSDRLHIYTTNYDCSLQVLASNSQNLSFLTHIDNTKGYFTERWYPTNLDATPELKNRKQSSIYIHRFHGCVAWYRDVRKPSSVMEIYGSGGTL